MTRIGLLSDTHGYLDEKIFNHFSSCDEIWHAGDFGNIGLAEELMEGVTRTSQKKPVLRGVYGNIDGKDVREVFPEKLRWNCEGVEVFMTHIGGYPSRYALGIKEELRRRPPQLFICGHSHILKIMYDESFHLLHMNPGAAGKQGWQKVRTIVRFEIDGKEIKNCQVIELLPR